MYRRNSKYSNNDKFNNDCKLTQKYAIKYRKNKQQIKRKFSFIKKKGKEGPLEVRKFRESYKNFSYQKTDVTKYRENKNDNEYFSEIGSCSLFTPAIGR